MEAEVVFIYSHNNFTGHSIGPCSHSGCTTDVQRIWHNGCGTMDIDVIQRRVILHKHVYTTVMGRRRNSCVIICQMYAKCSCTTWVWTGPWGARMIVRAECRSEDRLHLALDVCLFLLAILTVYILGEMVRDVEIWSHSGKLSYSSGPRAEGDKVARWPALVPSLCQNV